MQCRRNFLQGGAWASTVTGLTGATVFECGSFRTGSLGTSIILLKTKVHQIKKTLIYLKKFSARQSSLVSEQRRLGMTTVL